MRLAWITDPHFDHADEGTTDALFSELLSAAPDGVLLGGDIAEGDDLLTVLKRFSRDLPFPTWFVLGNHDFYRSDFQTVRNAVHSLCKREKNLSWLDDGRVVELTTETTLIGHGGWGDGRHGDFLRSPLTDVVADFICIPELAAMKTDLPRLQKRVMELGDESAQILSTSLPQALERSAQTLVLTHVPPFPETSWYRNQHSNPDGTPHFCCVAAGLAIQSSLDQHPGRSVTVLCGHTHNGGMTMIRPELTVFTGGARYRKPRITSMINVR